MEGVFFINTSQGNYIIKGTGSIGTETFATYLASYLGLRVPRVRVLSYSSSEWRTMKNKLFEKTEIRDPAVSLLMFDS